MPLYNFECLSCEESWKDFAPSENVGSLRKKCPKCGKRKGARVFGGGKLGVVGDTLDNHKHMGVIIKSDKWPKDKYGRVVVSSRSQEREVLRQVYNESKGTSQPIAPYDH